jgi:predicted metalloprotease with PDZ domain
MKAHFTRLLALAILVCAGLPGAARAAAAKSELKIEYTVKVVGGEAQLFHVTTDIDNLRQPSLDLTLPSWMPGLYDEEDYAKNVRRLSITDGQGKPLAHHMVARQTWRVETAGVTKLRAEFDYRADTLGVSTAKVGADYAFFTGVQLFLLPEGHARAGGRVRFEVPAGWAIASALRATADPTVFTAADYDELADAPTQFGHFDVTEFEAGGKPHTLVTTPAGSYPQEGLKEMAGMLKRVAEAEGRMFGGLPYDHYTFFYFFTEAGQRPGHAIEHANSFVCFPPEGRNATPDGEAWRAAHEIFHAWNVKRIRPAEMWPYDYSRENVTPLLWFSEGVTDYYASKTLLRAGFYDREQFTRSLAAVVGGLEGNEARTYVSPADASITTWLRARTLFPYDISFYDQGNALGLLLDLSLLRDTKGAAGLDEVMRRLYRDYYGRGRGFTTEDLVKVVSAVGGKDYGPFFDRYVRGTEPPPYDPNLGLAGYQFEKLVNKLPTLNLRFEPSPQGMKVIPGGAEAKGDAEGVKVGDWLLSIDGIQVRPDLAGVRERLADKIGQEVPVKVKRGGEEKTFQVKVSSRDDIKYAITELLDVSDEQMSLRKAWMKKGS